MYNKTLGPLESLHNSKHEESLRYEQRVHIKLIISVHYLLLFTFVYIEIGAILFKKIVYFSKYKAHIECLKDIINFNLIILKVSRYTQRSLNFKRYSILIFKFYIHFIDINNYILL